METEVLENDDIQFQVTFDWQGETKEGKLMKAKTHHTWILENDLQKESAKIKDIKVKYIEPFSVIGS